MENKEAVVFPISYGIIICLMIWFFVVSPIIHKWKQKHFWIYGTCNGKSARKHSIDKNVQFVLWKKGQHGYKEDFWINFDSSWWKLFKRD